jgi:peptide/nickel transport system permease protein
VTQVLGLEEAMDKLGYLVRRLFQGLVVLLCVIIFNFVILRLAPGDPAMIMAGESGASDEQFISDVRASYGLDKPVPVQLATYLKSIAALDFGVSYRQKRANVTLIAERLPATLLLTGSAFFLSLIFGVILGFVAARFRGGVDAGVSAVALTFYAMPLFWVGLLNILLFSVYLNWLPSFGMQSIIPSADSVGRALDILKHLVLPMMTLALFYTAVYARMMRSSLLEVRSFDFITTARAKGASTSRIWLRHMARNAFLPVLTMAGIQAGQMVGGSVLVETVFDWPGLGRLAFEAVFQRDYNLLLGLFIVTSAVVILINLVVDLLYVVLDPRVSLTS